MNKYLLFLAASFVTFSCQKTTETDLTKPTAELKNLSKSVDISQNTAQLAFELALIDDSELGSYKIEIHSDFDGHSHGRTEASYQAFAFDKAYVISGKNVAASEKITVPNTAATGLYHFQINYFDKSGNEGEFIVNNFEITHPQRQPKVVIDQPNFATEVGAEKGKNLALSCKVSDPDDLLEKVQVLLVAEEEKKGRKESTSPVFDKSFDKINATSLDVKLSIPIPSTIGTGHYALIIRCQDKSGNYKIQSNEIHIH